MTKVEKKWKILPGWEKDLIEKYPRWFLSVLANRGIDTADKVASFLNPEYGELLPSDSFLNIDTIAERILLARDSDEKIVIYGDYDVDGVTSVALMFSLLKSLGAQNVETYIPHREEEGYGLNEEAVSGLVKSGANLIITVDCGITSAQIIDNNRSKADFIIIDHHEIQADKVPGDTLILHPSLLKKGLEPVGLSACGMAFFLAKKMTEIKESHFLPGQEKWLLDLAALSTICDVVPLIGQNRIIVRYGLLVLAKTKRVGLLALANVAGIKLSEVKSYEVGFVLGPRLNASGRLESAQKSLNLLLTDSKTEAIKAASELNEINLARQALCQRILEEAKREIESSDKKNHEIYLLSNKNWPRGVVGIIASKISDSYSRPVIIFENDGEVHHGSARSIDGLDITESLGEISEHLIKFGGHAKAAGLSVAEDKWVIFQDQLLEIVRGKIKKEDLAPVIKIDTEIKEGDISEESLELISSLEPFGFGNANPSFVLRQVEIKNVNRVGQNKEHLKFSLAKSGISGISFSEKGDFKDGDLVDIAGSLKYNIWNNRKSIELRVLDMKKEGDKL